MEGSRKYINPYLAGVLLGLVIIASFFFTRFDLTSEKRYTLSDATKTLIKELDDIVYFKVYLDGEFPAGFKKLRNETKEMLDEFRAYNKNIQYEFINPSESEDKSIRTGLLLTAGLVAGEALTGVLIAVLIVLGIDLAVFTYAPWWPGLVIWMFIALLLAYIPIRHLKKL